MSEGVIIALITAIGSLMGGIIGQLIAASAAIKAATIKEKLNQVPDSKGNKTHSWNGVLSGALIGAILTLVVLAIFGLLHPSKENSPTPTVTAENKATQSPPSLTSISSNSFILFNNDFENGKMTGLSHSSGLWRIVQDENGNHVLDQDNINSGKNWNRILFGNMTWKNYVIECRMRFFDSDSSYTDFTNAGINFRYDDIDTLAGSYDASMLTRGTLYMGYGNYRTSRYFELAHSDGYNVVIKQWYKIRVEVDNDTYKFYINDVEVLEATDTTSLSGPAGFTVGPALHVQYDDISVTEITH